MAIVDGVPSTACYWAATNRKVPQLAPPVLTCSSCVDRVLGTQQLAAPAAELVSRDVDMEGDALASDGAVVVGSVVGQRHVDDRDIPRLNHHGLAVPGRVEATRAIEGDQRILRRRSRADEGYTRRK